MKNLVLVLLLLSFNTLLSQTDSLNMEISADGSEREIPKIDTLKTKVESEIKDIKSAVAYVDSMKKELKTAIDSLNKKFEKIEGKVVRFGVSIGYNTIYKDHLKNYQSVSIDIRDTTLKLEQMDPYSIKVSTSIIVSPFLKADWLVKARQVNKAKLDLLRNKKSELFKARIERIGTSAKVEKKSSKKKAGRVPFFKVVGANIGNAVLYTVQNIGIAANINILEFNKAQSNLAFNKSMEGGVGLCLRLHDNVYVSFSNELYFSRQLRSNIKAYENQKLYIDGKLVTSVNDLDVSNDNIFVTRNIIARSVKVVIIF